MSSLRRLSIALALLAAAPVPAGATFARSALPLLQDLAAVGRAADGAGDPEPAPKSMAAGRLVADVELDGRLDEAAWSGASWTSDFAQKEPELGAAPSVATRVALLYDDHALYVGARLESDDPDAIAAFLTRRDDPGKSEVLTVSLDTYGDRRTAYSFAVTAAGVRLDWYHPFDNEEERDLTFDPVWVARTAIDDQGWTAELRIPFSQLRFSGAASQRWGINVNRFIPSRNEDVYWVVVPRDETGWASRFGVLEGIEGIPSSSRIELVPYVASDSRFLSDGVIEPDDPFSEPLDVDARVGLDFRMGLGPSLTLDATLNPDFGQVEADPAEVNLTAFETFFEERRPFFTQARQAFAGVGPAYYYSRRIGGPPHHELDADYVEGPPATTIFGAAKLTGQLASGLTIGALAAVTDDERGREFDLATGEMRELEIEPVTSYAVARLQQQFGADASTIGATFTAVNRALGEESPLAGELPDAAYTGGIDFNRRFEDGWYELLGHVGFSHLTGDPAGILEIQERSAHYYQRPDQDHVDLDPTRTSLSGWSAALRGGKRTGRLRWNHGIWMDSPGFDTNDAGQLVRADDIVTWAGAYYRQTEPGSVLRNWELGAWTRPRWNFGGVQHELFVSGYGNATLKNFWSMWLESYRRFRSQSDTQTRGGPLMRNPSGWELYGGLDGNPGATTHWGVEGSLRNDEIGTWAYSVLGRFSTRPSDRLALSVEPRYARGHETRQYIDTFDGGREATFGERYLFGTIDRSEIAAPVRVNYIFSPDLSLELYAEPFASSGRYADVGELARPRDFDLRVYGEAEGTSIDRDAEGNLEVVDGDDAFTVENPDFDVLSFRSNLVLRWEWRPGSALFVTWQQNREHDGTDGRMVGPGDLADALAVEGENVLALKVSYWLPL